MDFFTDTGSIARVFENVRQLYELDKIPNKVVDGKESFPEDRQTLRHGVSIEFRHVSHRCRMSILNSFPQKRVLQISWK